MIDETTPVAFHDALPERVDVVVIGAGVIGLSTAWFLRADGVSVLVCEKGRVAGEQSSRNWGWIRQQGRDAAELPIVTESLALWEALPAEIGEDIGFTRCGVLYLAEHDAELEGFETFYTIARAHGLDTRLLGAAEAGRLTGTGPHAWRGGMLTPSDGRAEPFRAVPAIARAAVRRGVRLREQCAVRALDVEAGRVSGVITEHGRVRADAVVCAGGAWSSLFAQSAGVRLPQLAVRSTVARTVRARPFFDGNAASHRLAFRRRDDGGYTLAIGGFSEHFPGAASFRHAASFLPALRAAWSEVRFPFTGGPPLAYRWPRRWDADRVSPFERARVLNPAPSVDALKRLRERVDATLPPLAGVRFADAWAGMIDATPDFVPVMDAVEKLPGFYLATGFSGHGFGIGPGAGRVMADLVQSRPARHDLARFRLGRFSDGSPLVLGPVI